MIKYTLRGDKYVLCLTRHSKVYQVYNTLPTNLYDLGDGLYMDNDDKLYFYVNDGYVDYY